MTNAIALKVSTPVRFAMNTEVSLSERKLEAVKGSHLAVAQSFVTAKGKMGAAAREATAAMGIIEIARHLRAGNYMPAAQRLGIESGKCITINRRSDWEGLSVAFQMEVDSVKKTFDRKTGTTPTGKYAAALAVAATYNRINDLVARIIEAEKANTVDAA